jgi:hypothetical protein
MLVVTLALATIGCVRRYSEPAVTEPHATVKIRVLHHEQSGPQLDLAGRLAPDGEEYGIDLADGGIRVVRVRLVPTVYRVASSFFHTMQQMQTVFVSESYACGTQTSGYGTHSYSTTRYCTRSVPRQQWTTVRIDDGGCEATAFQTMPIEGGVYLVQYDYFGPGVCSLTCLRQIDTGGGTFRFVPCGAGEPPAVPIATSGGEESGATLSALPPASYESPLAPPPTSSVPAGDATGAAPASEEPLTEPPVP